VRQNGVAKLETGRENMKGKVLSLAVKYWCKVRHVDQGLLGREKKNMKFGSWIKKLKEDLQRIRLGFI
jgi:hypothetical protein